MKIRVAFTALTWSVLPAALLRAGPLINGYEQTNLVSSIPGLAANTDPNLKDPRGFTFSALSPLWVADNATGKATTYGLAGTPVGLVVTLQGTTPSPTGVVLSGTP